MEGTHRRASGRADDHQGHRSEHLQASGASIGDIGTILDVLAAVLQPVEVHFSWRPLLLDPADDMVLEAAINGRADAIVTFNVRDYGTIQTRFGIDVLRPVEVLRRLAMPERSP